MGQQQGGMGGNRGGGFGGNQGGGLLGQPGFRPSPRPMASTPLQPGMQTGGAEPYNAGSSTTDGLGGYSLGTPLPGSSATSGVGTTMQPTFVQGNVGNVQGPTNGPAPTNGPRLPPIPPGFSDPGTGQAWAQLYGNQGPLLPNNPDWFASPQGLAQQAAMAQRLTRGMGPGTLGQQRHDPIGMNRGPTESGQPPVDRYAQRLAGRDQSSANWANPDWRMQQVLAGAIAPTNNAELQAMMAQMSPADRQAYIDKYKSIGLDPTFQGGGGTGPFGN